MSREMQRLKCLHIIRRLLSQRKTVHEGRAVGQSPWCFRRLRLGFRQGFGPVIIACLRILFTVYPLSRMFVFLHQTVSARHHVCAAGALEIAYLSIPPSIYLL